MSEPMTDERLAALEELSQDVAKVLGRQSGWDELVAEIRLSWATGAKLQGVIAKLQNENAELAVLVAELEAANRELRRRINEALTIPAGSVSIGWLPNKMVEILRGEK